MQKDRTNELSRSLPQLYRFCFLMTGDQAKAQQAFQNTVREAALLASRAQLPTDRLWAFHEARHQCLALTQTEPQAEAGHTAEEPITPHAAAGVAQIQPEQLATWIAASPEPQRSALAFFYLNEFSHREMQNLLDLKMNELASLISRGRAQFQPWLQMMTADPTTA